MFSAKPKFAKKSGATSADIGNAVHKLMQVCDIKLLCDNPDAEMERLQKNGKLTDVEVRLIDKTVVSKFINSDVVKILLNSYELFRERQFIMQIDIELLREDGTEPSGDLVMLQGVIDCLCVDKDGNATIIDYKTDRVKQESTLIERYKKQIELYSYAVEKEFGYNVTKKIIYSFSLGKSVEL